MRKDLDDAIVDLLVQDTRVTHRQIAQEIGVAESTARVRLQNIIDSGRVTPSVLVHPDIEEDGFIYMARIRVDESVDVRQVAEADSLATSPWIAQVSTSGELIVQQFATGLEAMSDGLAQIRALDGVTRIQTNVVLRLYVGASWDTSSEHSQHWASQPNRGVDDIDRALVVALRQDGRASYTSLAALVGLTVAATRRRVLRLVEDGVLRFATRVRGEIVRGYEAAVDLLVDVPDSTPFINDLCAMASVRYVIDQTGHYNLSCYVVADDTTALARAVGRIVEDPRVVEFHTDPLLVLRDRVSWTATSS